MAVLELMQRRQDLPGQRLAESVAWGLRAALLIGVLLAATALGLLFLQSRPVMTIDQAEKSSAEADRPSGITHRKPGANGALISLDAARESLQRFGGAEGLELEGVLERGASGASSYAIWYFEAPGEEEELSYKVDARTREVLEMLRLNALGARAGAPGASQVQAESLAEQFAAPRFLGFQTLTLVERTIVPAARNDQLFSFKWALVAPESGAELPTSVSVSVSAASGEVALYLAQRESPEVATRPAIAREEAIAAAAVLAERASLWDVRAPGSVRLQIVYNQDNRQQLVWAISFPARPEAAPSGRTALRLLIDAQTGEPVANPS